jgi:hypothetical protein
MARKPTKAVAKPSVEPSTTELARGKTGKENVLLLDEETEIQF